MLLSSAPVKKWNPSDNRTEPPVQGIPSKSFVRGWSGLVNTSWWLIGGLLREQYGKALVKQTYWGHVHTHAYKCKKKQNKTLLRPLQINCIKRKKGKNKHSQPEIGAWKKEILLHILFMFKIHRSHTLILRLLVLGCFFVCCFFMEKRKHQDKQWCSK